MWSIEGSAWYVVSAQYVVRATIITIIILDFSLFLCNSSIYWAFSNGHSLCLFLTSLLAYYLLSLRPQPLPYATVTPSPHHSPDTAQIASLLHFFSFVICGFSAGTWARPFSALSTIFSFSSVKACPFSVNLEPSLLLTHKWSSHKCSVSSKHVILGAPKSWLCNKSSAVPSPGSVSSLPLAKSTWFVINIFPLLQHCYGGVHS